RVLEGDARGRLDAETLGSLEIDLGMRLAPADVVSGDGDVDPPAQAERVEHALEILARGGGGDRAWHAGARERLHARAGAAHRHEAATRQARVVLALEIGEPARLGVIDVPHEE